MFSGGGGATMGQIVKVGVSGRARGQRCGYFVASFFFGQQQHLLRYGTCWCGCDNCTQCGRWRRKAATTALSLVVFSLFLLFWRLYMVVFTLVVALFFSCWCFFRACSSFLGQEPFHCSCAYPRTRLLWYARICRVYASCCGLLMLAQVALCR